MVGERIRKFIPLRFAKREYIIRRRCDDTILKLDKCALLSMIITEKQYEEQICRAVRRNCLYFYNPKHIIKEVTNMKKTAVLLALLVLMVSLPACRSPELNWGSFTAEKTESFDHKYYAVQTKEDLDLVVTVFNCATGAEVFSFSPARAWDFWGICWESDSYNIWIQSGDIGVKCYRFDNEEWTLDEQAVRPADIVSKYD